ncbi:MAG: histidinol dehydrogenase, partial [Candidatus Bathyarchaeota archaeon]|nr:histidinol dehydrogenase [Candidatus Bathyarchaeota archaeon]
AALVDFSMKFDGAKLSPDRLQVTREDIDKAYEKVSADKISAIEFAKNRVEAFQKQLLERVSFEYEATGVRVRSCTSPIRRVGCYVPSSQVAYPSSLVMTLVPAKVAGVPEVVVCSPPRSAEEINPLILAAADICGVDEVYRVGGAQAIAALAYGTATIRPVDKLFGPGSKYVLTAKMLVSRDLPIDFPAGPSEIMVVADETADPQVVALDMVSQAEHVDGVPVLVATSERFAETVVNEIERMVSSLPNKEMVAENLSRNGLVLVCEDVDEAVRFVNEFAPEHLEVMVEDAWGIAEKITSAGLVLIGKYTPVAASDYCLGTVHVLPTGGFSRVYSGLSVLDFIKRFSIAECSEEGLSEIWENVKALAESEGLLNHALAVEGRFKDAETE